MSLDDSVEGGQSLTLGGEYKIKGKNSGNDIIKAGLATVLRDNEETNLPTKSTDIDYVITHSFGAVPCSFTLSENYIDLKKIIFIAPPDHFTDWINDVAKLIGINQKIIDITLEKFKKDYDMNPYEMSVSRWIKNVNNIEGLIIHGEKDKITPLERAINVNSNWQGSRLEVIPNIGHFKILDSKNTTSEILKYLKD